MQSTINLSQTTMPRQRVATAELFPEMPPIEGRITCRACGAAATVPIDHPALLCALCLSDLDATRKHVAACVDAVLSRLDQAKAEWTEMLDFSPAKERWAKVQAAMIAVAEGRVAKETLARTWALRKTEGGPLAVLLSSYEVYARDTDQCAAELERWGRAQDEINAAWLAEPGGGATAATGG